VERVCFLRPSPHRRKSMMAPACTPVVGAVSHSDAGRAASGAFVVPDPDDNRRLLLRRSDSVREARVADVETHMNG
jgi:hypothetical protein